MEIGFSVTLDNFEQRKFKYLHCTNIVYIPDSSHLYVEAATTIVTLYNIISSKSGTASHDPKTHYLHDFIIFSFIIFYFI